MKTKTNVGFTLIELLVVVLIIGILAAVALPQYTKAVEKSRTAEVVTLMGDIMTGERIYQLSQGGYTTDLTALDIEVPNIGSGNAFFTTNNYTVTMTNGTGAASTSIIATAVRNSSTPYTLTMTLDKDGGISRDCDGDVCSSMPDWD